MDTTTATGEVVRWYTRARRFPHLIGRTPDGARIWGGPYTLTQAVGAGVMLFAGVNTTSVWARHGLFGNAALLLGATYTLVLVLGRIPVGSRNPVSVLAGAVHALAAPRTGRLGGRPVRLRRPRHLRHRLTQQAPAVPTRPAPAPSAASACVPPASVPPAAEEEGVGTHPRTCDPTSTRTSPPASPPAPAPALLPASPAAPLAVHVPAPSPSPENTGPPPAPVLTGVQVLLAQAAPAGRPERPASGSGTRGTDAPRVPSPGPGDR